MHAGAGKPAHGLCPARRKGLLTAGLCAGYIGGDAHIHVLNVFHKPRFEVFQQGNINKGLAVKHGIAQLGDSFDDVSCGAGNVLHTRAIIIVQVLLNLGLFLAFGGFVDGEFDFATKSLT